jgi:hypothetical protein
MHSFAALWTVGHEASQLTVCPVKNCWLWNGVAAGHAASHDSPPVTATPNGMVVGHCVRHSNGPLPGTKYSLPEPVHVGRQMLGRLLRSWMKKLLTGGHEATQRASLKNFLLDGQQICWLSWEFNVVLQKDFSQ